MTYNTVELIQFDLMSNHKEVRHGYTTRQGGVSEGVFNTMNLGFNRGDKEENVRENYQRLALQLGISVDDFVLSKQVHESTVIRVDERHRGNGFNYEQQFLGVDGFVTNDRHVALVTFFADCVPLFFYDPIKSAIGMSHAGWRGTVLHIGPKTVQKMRDEFGSLPEDILVGIGPSIGACCYEVSEDVKKQFDLSFNDDIIASVVYPTRDKYHLDLWKANELDLIEAGIKKEHIEQSKLCTQCHASTFFSHRVMGNDRGSQVGILSLV